MVDVDSGSLYMRTHSLSRLPLVLGPRPLGAVLHSLNAPGELSQWLCHDNSIINIVLESLLLLLLLYYYYYQILTLTLTPDTSITGIFLSVDVLSQEFVRRTRVEN